MLEKQITFTYGELIEAFDSWNKVLEQGEVPERPTGNTYGEMFCNYLIESVNKIRTERLTTYRK
jgi:hypothetical protein